jgi:hypothetical protein
MEIAEEAQRLVLMDLKEQHQPVEPPEVLEERQVHVMGTIVQRHSVEMVALAPTEYLVHREQPLLQHLEQDIICRLMELTACPVAELMVAAVAVALVKIIMVAMEVAELLPEVEAEERLLPFSHLIL